MQYALQWMTGFWAIVMALSLAGCGFQISGNTVMPSVPLSLENVTETKPVTEDGISAAAESSAETDKILIAYFTWAENAADTSGVDATTSASVQVPGNGAWMAEWIQQETGGDLFSIRAVPIIPGKGKYHVQASQELKGHGGRAFLAVFYTAGRAEAALVAERALEHQNGSLRNHRMI